MIVICPYPTGVAAGQRLKYEQYLEDWRQRGWIVSVHPFLSVKVWSIAYKPGYLLHKVIGVLTGTISRLSLLLEVRNADLVYIFMWVTPFGSTFFERCVRLLAKNLIFDLEDDVLTRNNTNLIVYDPNPILRFFRSNNKAQYLIKTADHVIVSSPFLRDQCLATFDAKACTYITSSVDTNTLKPRTSYRGSPVTLGWTGTFSSMAYLNILSEVLQRLATKVDFKMIVIGNFDYHLPGVDCRIIQWSLKTEVVDLQEIDIGLYPLPSNRWVNGKSGLKAIQYMAAGIPVVASRVGINSSIIDDNETGFLADNEEDWFNYLYLLVRDDVIRRRLGENARSVAIRRFSRQVVSTQYSEIIDSLS